jgi:hypothetical protein
MRLLFLGRSCPRRQGLSVPFSALLAPALGPIPPASSRQSTRNLQPRAATPKYASQLIKEALGLPSHDLRTLAADLLRMIDPATAPGKATDLLGHSDPDSQAEYQAAARGLVASRKWAEERDRLR